MIQRVMIILKNFITSLDRALSGSDPRILIRTMLILGAAMIFTAICMWTSGKRNESIRSNRTDKRVIAAKRTAAYYTRKAQQPVARIRFRGHKPKGWRDPIRNGIVPTDAVDKLVWGLCYTRYVMGLAMDDDPTKQPGMENAPRRVRDAAENAYWRALESIPDTAQVRIEPMTRRGKTKASYRFSYGYNDVLKAASPNTRRAAALLEMQGFKCAKCGTDPDSGRNFMLNGNTTICDECFAMKTIGTAIATARYRK